MQTIRGRLAVGYALALGATLVVFAVIIYLVQSAATFAELDRRVRSQANLIAAALGESYRARDSIVVLDSLTQRRVVDPDVARLLEDVPGYVVVLGPRGSVLLLSPDAHALRLRAVQLLVDSAQAAVDRAQREGTAGGIGLVDLGPPAGRLRYYVRTVPDAGPLVTAVVSGVSTQALAELDSRLRAEADLIAGILGESHRARAAVVTTDPRTGAPTLSPTVAAMLDVVPGYVMVLGEGRTVLYRSAEARTLSFAATQALQGAARQLEVPGSFGFLDLGPPVGRLRFFGRPTTDLGEGVVAVVSGAPANQGALLGPPRFLTAVLWTAPFVIAASLGIGYLLVRQTLKPVESIVDEVEAISDGRSLHRRLAEPTSHDELARLTSTLNAMLARLERSFGMLRRFTADASHELKTPLTVLRSGIERSITHPQTPPELMEVLEETLFEVNRMAELVDSLLTLARADEGRAPLHLDDVDLRELLGEMAETASFLGEQASVDIAVQVPDQPCPMRIDRGRVRQLLMNLVTNAIKYTPAGGNVWIDAALDDGRVVLTVRDSGIGIAPGDLPHIFDRFWRADPARSRSGTRPGAGLGLAISKWIAEAHGGKIEVQSRPGRGTIFTVRLPVGHERLGDDATGE